MLQYFRRFTQSRPLKQSISSSFTTPKKSRCSSASLLKRNAKPTWKPQSKMTKSPSAWTPDAPPYAAIVEECFPESALSDPFVFFDAVGDPDKFNANLATMMDSCDRFIDRGTIDVIPTSQYNF